MKLLTKQEIQCYLNKHTFLDFWYMSKIYTLEKSWTSRISRYSLIAADALPQWRNSLDELCEQVYIDEGILLRDALNNIKVPEFDDPSWESYEAARHSAIVYGNEIHFVYDGNDYWIAHTKQGLSHLSDNSGNTQIFPSCRVLFENARVDGKPLKDIWGKAVVDIC